MRALAKVEFIADTLSTRVATICLVPDLFQFDLLNSRVSDVDGLPVIHIADEPPMEFRRIAKRLIDIGFSFLVLIVLSPVLFLIALVVKLSSSGSVLYRQTRMGLNGHTFEMLKFRSDFGSAECA